MLGSSTKHLKRRKLADAQYHLNAVRMGEKYSNKKRVQIFNVGDTVALRIPRIDRAATDMHRLPCIIIQQQGKKYFLYRLRCKFGVLSTLYPASELEEYRGPEQLEVHGWEIAPKIGLREAAKRANPANTYYGTSCHCKKGCHGKQCSCRRAKKPCSTRCHSGKACSNCQLNAPPSLDTSPSLNAPPSLDASPSLDIPPQSPICIDDSCPSPPPTQWWVRELQLQCSDKVTLENGSWLSDVHISAAQRLLQLQFPEIGGLQPPVLGSKLQFSVLPPQSVQILNSNKQHWICISTIDCIPGHVKVYDSLYPTPSMSAVRQICNLLQAHEPEVVVEMMDVQTQTGGDDCGLFAIAFALAICSGNNPCHFTLRQDLMRSHLSSCFGLGVLSPFPLERRRRKVLQDVRSSKRFPVFCSCRMLEDKKGMCCLH